MKGKTLITIVLVAASNLAVAGIGEKMESSHNSQADEFSTQASVSNNQAKMKVQEEVNHHSNGVQHYDAVTNKHWQSNEVYDYSFDYSDIY